MKRVSFDTMQAEIRRVLLSRGFSEERAAKCALLFAEASLEGVYSHGLNRVPRFVDYVDKGWVDIHAEPVKVDATGMLERYDGKLGPGNLNAQFCMQRAIELAKENGVGMVALRNTNHWMRGGSYGWQAARQGCIGLCWTNTESCMPPWGARETKVGNNPFVLAVPRAEGSIVLDMAMSQFSYGKLEVTRLKNELLPVDGGFDSEGRLTRDPASIEQSMRILPTGYWKGSGLSFLLDLIAALLAGGWSTRQMDEGKPSPGVSGYGGSQVFIAVDPAVISGGQFTEELVNGAVDYLHQAEPAEMNGRVSFPGERTAQTRQQNLEQGIPVDEAIWQRVVEL